MSDKIVSEELDFDDVSIRPNRSSLNSRSEVDLYRDIKWRSPAGNQHILRCKTLCASNMGTVGTPRMARELSTRGYLCALEKHYTAEDINALYDELEKKAVDSCCIKDTENKYVYTDRVAISIGMNESMEVLKEVSQKHKVNIVNIDTPNGYCPRLLERVREVRELLPESFIIAGTVVTGDIVTDLIQHGANCVRVGICAGCFQGDMKVMTNKGLKSIKDIDVDEKVLTHTGKFQTVTNKFIFNTHKHFIEINGIKCTPNHKFYVADLSDLKKINAQNYKKYCKWIQAKDLDPKKHKLIKIIDIQ